MLGMCLTRWLRNISQSVDVLVIQDMIECFRTQTSMVDPATGDVMRYSFSADGKISSFEGAFDLSSLGDRVIDKEFYHTSSSAAETKFVCALDLKDLGS